MNKEFRLPTVSPVLEPGLVLSGLPLPSEGLLQVASENVISNFRMIRGIICGISFLPPVYLFSIKYDHLVEGYDNKYLLIGFSTSGNLLEVLYNDLGDDKVSVFHAWYFWAFA